MKRPLFPELPRPILFAHRGCSYRAPENTMPAFRLAAELGMPAVELDIQLSADDELVIFHDETLERVCGRPGRIRDYDREELSRMDAGARKDSAFAGTPIPLLEELLRELGDRLRFDIEIKYYRPADTATILERLAACLEDYEERVIISSFDPRIVRAARRRLPGIPAGLIWDAVSLGSWIPPSAALLFSGADFGKPDYRLLDSAAERGAGNIVWTVDDRQAAVRCRERGVVGIISNRPEDLVMADAD